MSLRGGRFLCVFLQPLFFFLGLVFFSGWLLPLGLDALEGGGGKGMGCLLVWFWGWAKKDVWNTARLFFLVFSDNNNNPPVSRQEQGGRREACWIPSWALGFSGGGFVSCFLFRHDVTTHSLEPAFQGTERGSGKSEERDATSGGTVRFDVLCVYLWF